MSAGENRGDVVMLVRMWRRTDRKSFPDCPTARTAVMALRARGFHARLEIDPSSSDEEPEHRGDRRRFLVWAVLCGFAPPERLTERIVADVEGSDS